MTVSMTTVTTITVATTTNSSVPQMPDHGPATGRPVACQSITKTYRLFPIRNSAIGPIATIHPPAEIDAEQRETFGWLHWH
jgi:hypothetical protein